MRLRVKMALAFIGLVWAFAQAANAQSVGGTSVRDGWVMVSGAELLLAMKAGEIQLTTSDRSGTMWSYENLD